MTLFYLESVDSTQNYLKELVRTSNIQLPHAVVSNIQTDGIGSRGNAWQGLDGNLFLSFAIALKDLPSDLKIESSSIYFAYLLKETLRELNSEVWLKWPNDFYLDKFKIGGMITNIVKDVVICGVGLNLAIAPEGFSTLDISISREELLKKYFLNIEKKILWKQVFSKYKLEFYKNQNFFTHTNNLRISLEGASLESDGSVTINGKRIFSLR
ncbi:MAG: biotin--[acetyl-CoA-carboxylase] ligase [Epsilonproteobacteria bacterium]|nr:biotin--[acetyl-CoA-carboxylase] ligase [Campylobacterota bacterium]PIP10766.1 MAG: biotin--[acetyl-CoA-carboxylase] ligase [Sulfurimonas sp. CG23_combo_of_CG06-09_8_20_14_all_36_33]PIS24227.1 MAG: biotin--[acetyl-CoA-carboxylase] ligase [Sulfurimonas sp. CG08_land_8_20_14_0_20_36_33]PIU36032.1 MAG: biotin--[acetyl-CoA-carboxylase] ligase [Sulfurimonas sp. CG07_land_8_20_14_0_80_36_56]PIV04377.1 MAG: biotin--[acetyl-CoA-carboxylase] ligase [Sulfurimonas sp. CG03_land_8_20_14_0_80_36_25]PIV3